ncbi:MAG TPA: energy transducer TonB, partial [Methylomirabilota bacterium]|nr:energy transducer TonB [Methylomirabilota bacterium]
GGELPGGPRPPGRPGDRIALAAEPDRGSGAGARGAGESRVAAPAVPGLIPNVGGGGGATGGPAGAVALLPREASGALPPEYDGYVQGLRQRIQGHLRYPWLAARRGLQGVVELEVRLSPEGGLAGVDVIGGAAAGPLREAALRAVRDAAPFPLPAGVPARPLTIRLPVVFELR